MTLELFLRFLPNLLTVILLELVLSFDNASVIALRVAHLPPVQREKARYYGVLGGIVARGALLLVAGIILSFSWLKLIGGGYLLILAYNGLYKTEDEHNQLYKNKPGFWKTVLICEFLDVIFALDNVLSISALTKMPVVDLLHQSVSVSLSQMIESPGFWVAFIGTIIGMLAMRFASQIFSWLLERYKGVEKMAFFAIGLLGIKIFISGVVYCLHAYANQTWAIDLGHKLDAHEVDFGVSVLILIAFCLPVVLPALFKDDKTSQQELTENL